MTTSPCIGLCRLDPSWTYCLGCSRTRQEVAAWRDASPAVLKRIWAELPERRATQGVRLHRLNWSIDELADVIEQTLAPACGVWAIGDAGAASEFPISADDPWETIRDGPSRVIARTSRNAIRFDVPEQVRALSQAGLAENPKQSAIVLAVPRGRMKHGSRRGLTALGPDQDAIDPADRRARLYDLGLATPGAAFCLRTDVDDLIQRLEDGLGLAWSDLSQVLRPSLQEAASPPTWVVLGPIGRMETLASSADAHEPPFSRPAIDRRKTLDGLDALETLTPCGFYTPPVASEGSLSS